MSSEPCSEQLKILAESSELSFNSLSEDSLASKQRARTQINVHYLITCDRHINMMNKTNNWTCIAVVIDIAA